jgi:hypothetical protein
MGRIIRETTMKKEPTAPNATKPTRDPLVVQELKSKTKIRAGILDPNEHK